MSSRTPPPAFMCMPDVANGHTASNTPDPIRTRKSSGARPGQYWGGGPPGKSLGCCWLYFFLHIDRPDRTPPPAFMCMPYFEFRDIAMRHGIARSDNNLNLFGESRRQRIHAGLRCQKLCCGSPHRGAHRSHRRRSAVTCSADREPPS